VAQIKVFYEPETELLTIFWQSPRLNQIATELGNDIILFQDADTNEPIGIEVLSYRPGDDRINGISLELGQQNLVKT
jgi:hypothetical protein